MYISGPKPTGILVIKETCGKTTASKKSYAQSIGGFLDSVGMCPKKSL